ncbi:type IV pilin protein [Dyella choica]|uniref:Prepilin-type N-terminal cleavage/methylation domain-containing protein n=1 Tax=Dyella choica TaxID=1927959 RepID=A0A3S0PQP5_9GAMM|nr:type IV pilin protein [Dyella choica]RUL78423.1 prepilin-type N-terminal cleavage/methylation domain-containing protein [Dyella choica]
MDRLRGFSLIELITVMAIAAILAALATQSYSRYVFRSHRADAHQALMMIAQAQERWYATYNRYADDLGKLGMADSAISEHGYYALALRVLDKAEQGFVAMAMPIGRQLGDACGNLSIDNAGRKLPDSADVKANANGSCW